MRLLALLAIFTLSFTQTSQQAWAKTSLQDTDAKQAVVIDFETGQVLLDKDSTKQMPTSSMSKVMTCFMVFDALKNGTIDMDSEFPVSEEAWKKGGSKMFVEVGKSIKVKDLLRGVIVQSGNDATIVLAEGIAGSEDRFASKMTDRAHELGMKDSNFANASGWPDPNHYSTAHDLAVLAKHMITDYPEYYKLFAEKEFTYNNIKQQNRNPLLYRNIGADGLKTGHTEAGGYGLIGTAEADGRRVIMVVNGLTSEKDRAEEGSRLISWGLNAFINKTLFQAKQKVTLAPVARGAVNEVPVLVADELRVTIPKASKNDFTVDLQYKTPLIAPIKEGDEIGVLTLNVEGMDPITRPLIAAQSVESSGFFKQVLGKMKYTLLGKI